MSNTVHVKGISSKTSEKEVRDFFSFCGKISNISVTPDAEADGGAKTQEATVTFEKETAAKTALLLDNTQLGAEQVKVTSASSSGTSTSGTSTSGTSTSGGQSTGTKSGSGHDESIDELAQEDKPRSRIIAEYLAHGYVVSDGVIERAIQLDQQHGVSNRFTNALTQFDSKYKVTEKAQAVDQKVGATKTASQGWASLSSYFEKAAGTPTGQRIRSFYEQGQKQVLDVHNEAKHLASLKAGKPILAGGSTTTKSAEEAEMEKVNIDGKERTKCNCGGVDAQCPCEAGKCACSGCHKAS
nr:hypothetical protein B0A51_15035 [Rachicladosporium sp. CCFEE 5018]